MRRPARIFFPLSVLLLLAAGLAACAPSDPLSKAIEERSRWNVDLLGWAATEDGRVTVSTRLSGPVHGSLESFTVRVAMLDAANEPVERVWHTFDLRSIERGGPKDVLFDLPAPEREIEALSIERVLDPMPEEMESIEELRGLSPSGNGPAGS